VCEVNCKIFFLADVLVLGLILDSDEYIFSWQMCFIWGVVTD